VARSFAFVASAFAAALLGCSSENVIHVSPDGGAIDASTFGDARPVDAGPDVDKSATCAMSFDGGPLTPAFGRIDGTVLAVVPPNDQACAFPNRTHLVIQVMTNGDTYRMVVDVLSAFGSPDVLLDEVDAPLAAGAWAEGWHPGVVLDYVTTLGVHSPAFVAMKQADLVTKITAEIELGAHISIFATNTAAEPTSAHLVHRNLANADGAIVIRPDSASPHYLLLSFGDQTF
jgi:hypothetical protein